MMEEHEEVHSGIRWRRVCAIFEEHPLWKAVNPEERKDVFEDVTFSLARKERVSVCVCVGISYIANLVMTWHHMPPSIM